MTNEQYLVASYFGVAVLSIGFCIAVFLFLRRSFGSLADIAPRKSIASILKRLFPCGLVLPALLGFVSVSYWGCNHEKYEQIVNNRDYIFAKSQEQVSSALDSILVAVLVWNLVGLIVLKCGQMKKASEPPAE